MQGKDAAFGGGSAACFPNLSALHLRILAMGCQLELPWGKAGVRDGTWGSSGAACARLPAWLGTLCTCRRERKGSPVCCRAWLAWMGSSGLCQLLFSPPLS